jgi:nucleoside-diphosphate-sugar epimerase
LRSHSPSNRKQKDSPSVLWVGGTSALARTFFEEVYPTVGWRIVVAAPFRPAWKLPDDVVFVTFDMTSAESAGSLFSRLPRAVDALILGVRVSLVWSRPEQHTELAAHLELLLRAAARSGCTSMLHISSIAVSDHVTAQHLVDEDDSLPAVEALAPYDQFKLRSELLVDSAFEGQTGVRTWTHLRISGIFSNDPACIQCTAVRRQALVATRAPAAIDFNSSCNVAHAIALTLERQHAGGLKPGRHVYYYTRCTADPVPYWRHIRDYRAAMGIWYGVLLPGWMGTAAARLLRACFSVAGGSLAHSLHYLISVSLEEHTADNSKFRAAFPKIGEVEESIHDAFVRIRRRRAEELATARAAPWSAVGLLFLLVFGLLVAWAVQPLLRS